MEDKLRESIILNFNKAQFSWKSLLVSFEQARKRNAWIRVQAKQAAAESGENWRNRFQGGTGAPPLISPMQYPTSLSFLAFELTNIYSMLLDITPSCDKI